MLLCVDTFLLDVWLCAFLRARWQGNIIPDLQVRVWSKSVHEVSGESGFRSGSSGSSIELFPTKTSQITERVSDATSSII